MIGPDLTNLGGLPAGSQKSQAAMWSTLMDDEFIEHLK